MKTYLKTITNGVFGFLLSIGLYIGYFYVRGFITQIAVLVGLYVLVKLQMKNKPTKQDCVIHEVDLEKRVS